MKDYEIPEGCYQRHGGGLYEGQAAEDGGRYLYRNHSYLPVMNGNHLG